MSTDSHFDAIVVGSGFGGSVAAYRLASAGLRVCVLERGKPYPPGSFARRPSEMAANFWDPSAGRHGLFNVWSFRNIEALVASGLGGGSLIYANVLLRKDEKWFTQPVPGGGYETWPLGYSDLETHYSEVEKMLGAQRFPFASPGYSDTHKTRAMQQAAAGLGLDWTPANLAVSFANPGRAPAPGELLYDTPYPNIFGRPRLTCRMCGECDVGCNEGSKNTLDHTYLSAAKSNGADIRVLCEVKAMEPRAGGGYSVRYVEHRPENEGRPTRTDKLSSVTLTGDRLILGAGALGTPYLLLRNRKAFPGVGSSLGSRFSGNGDLLGFLLRSHEQRDGRRVPRRLDASRGPVITSYARVPDEVDGGDGPGYYIEDAGYPIALDWLLEGTTAPRLAGRLVRLVVRRLCARVTGNPRSDISAEIGRLLGGAQLSSSSLPLLGMGRDTPDGTMRLRRGQLDVKWTMKTSAEFFSRVDDTMSAIAGQLDADFHRNPLWRFKRAVTVHPLGGAPMGRDESSGVVDADGEVFNHPGLFVADGSVMPGPVGANPSLTIAAYADRMAVRMLEGRGRPATTARPPAAASPAPPTALEFTEEMKGYVTFGQLDHEVGYRQGRESGESLMFHLTLKMDDVERFLADQQHACRVVGYVDSRRLGQRRPVDDGEFNLFVESDGPEATQMRYRLLFSDDNGAPLTLQGFKTIRDDPGFDVWSDTTTLYTRILEGHVPPGGDAEVRAAGILRIHMRDFLRQLTTFRAQGPTLAAEAKAVAAFGRLFVGELWDVYHESAQRVGDRG